MKTTRLFTLLVVILLAACWAQAQAQNLSGREVMQKAKNRPDGDTRYAMVEMTLLQKSGRKRVRKLESWSMDEGQNTKTIMFFTYPGDVKGTGFLSWTYNDPSKNDDKWLYLPAMKKTRRISGKSSRTDYFMGSDFTYNDMSSRNVDEEEHTLLREETVAEHKCWVVESKPKDKEELYSRRITWIRQDCLLPVKAEYYDKLNKLHRRLSVSQVKQVDGYWTIQAMNMENVQTGHATEIKMSGQEYDLKLTPSMFTVARLEKGL